MLIIQIDVPTNLLLKPQSNNWRHIYRHTLKQFSCWYIKQTDFFIEKLPFFFIGRKPYHSRQWRLKLTTETLKQGEIKFTPCSSVSVVTFEQVNAGWDVPYEIRSLWTDKCRISKIILFCRFQKRDFVKHGVQNHCSTIFLITNSSLDSQNYFN